MKKSRIEYFERLKKEESFNTKYLLFEDAEPIEDKVARIVENNEPITDGAPLVYTKRSEGVKPEYDIRTDKWEVAQEKMEKVTEAKRNKIKESMTKGLPNNQKIEEEQENKLEN